MEVIFNQLPYVEQRFSELLSSFLIGVVSIFVATLVFLGWRNAIITSVTLPLAGFLVLSTLMLLGIPLHQMSISGLVISMGLLIDNAIVVTDEVERKLKAGSNLTEVILETARFLAIPLCAATLTTVFSFAPIALMPGATGEFVGTIAVSTIIAVVFSLGLSLTVVPALAHMLLKRYVTKPNRVINPFRLPEKLFRWVLSCLVRMPRFGLALTLIIPVAFFAMATSLELQFFPPAERDQFQIQLELASNASMSETESLASEIRRVALEDPRIEQVHWFIGESAPAFYYNIVPDKSNLPNYAQALVKCRSREEAPAAIQHLQNMVLRRFPQAHCVVRPLEQGPPFSAPIEILVLGKEIQVLQRLGEEIRLVLSKTPLITHTRSEMQESVPKIVLNIDDQAAYLAGYDPSSIAQTLNDTLNGSTGGSIQEGTEEIPIRVRLSQDKRRDLNEVVSLHLKEQIGSAKLAHQGIPVSAITQTQLAQFSGGILRKNGQRCNEIHAFISAGALPSTVLKDFRARLAESGFQLPDGYSIRFEGAAGEQETALGNLLTYAVLCGTALFTTLVLSINSFRLAILLVLAAFLSVSFSMASLYLAGLPLGFMAIVGIVGMLGVVANDSLIVLASIQADESARRGSTSRIVDVVTDNARHVILTTVSTLAGFLPLYLAGGAFWPPVAICVSFGVLGASYLALFFIPCGYLVLNRFPFPKVKWSYAQEFLYALDYAASPSLSTHPIVHRV